MSVVIAGLALAILFGVSQLGSLVSDDISQTADGIGDPAKLVNHPRLTGEPNTPPDNRYSDDNNVNKGGKKDKKGKDKKGKGKKNNRKKRGR